MAPDKKKLFEQLDALKVFPNNKLVRQLRKQIQDKLSNLEVSKVKTPISVDSNLARSKGLKQYHHYMRLIRNNFPDLKYSEIRKQFSLRKQGKESKIPEAVWQNPSP
ncbi:MAG: hypothetical protein ACRDFB_02385 [Rhabdochlamydiaceae bacterium]